jgi:hypothetical protein
MRIYKRIYTFNLGDLFYMLKVDFIFINFAGVPLVCA